MGTVLLTGSAGFIGSHIAGALLARGERVVGVDNFDPFYDQALKRRNVAETGMYELIEADIADPGAVRAVFERVRPESLVHLAAKAGVRPSLKDPVGYARVNVTGTAVLLQEAARAGCRRIVIASSSSVYGNNRKAPFAETDPVDEPISPYAATKRACELVAHASWSLTGIPTAMLRFFTVFGARQRPDLAIMAFMRRIAAGEEIELFGDGSMSRDYTYVGDTVSGVLAALDRIDRFGFRIWNLGSDRPVRLDEMVRTIAGVLGREPRIRRLPVQPGDVERTWADLTRSRAELGYSPGTPFEEGIRRQWDWLQRSRG